MVGYSIELTASPPVEVFSSEGLAEILRNLESTSPGSSLSSTSTIETGVTVENRPT